MDYTQSPNNLVDVGTGFRRHEDNQALPTVVSEKDMNSVIWGLMEVNKAAGIVASGFDETVPATYKDVAQAVKRLAGANVTVVTFAMSPFALTADHAGLVLVDCTAGNVVLNLPAANVVTALPIEYIEFKTDASANTATTNRAGANTIDGVNSFVLTIQYQSRTIRSNAVDAWITSGSNGAANTNKQIQSLTATVAASALTLGLAASTLDFRNAALTNGAPTSVTSGALSLVVPSGATLGGTSAQLCRLAILELNNAGSGELAVANANGGLNFDETTLISTTAISAGANSASVIYSATARASVPLRVVGYIESTQAAIGTWATAPSLIQGAGGLSMNALVGPGTGKWINRTGSRSQTVTYYNTDSVSRKVSIYGGTGASTDEYIATIDGVVTTKGGYAGTSLYSNMSIFFEVPAGSSYSVASSGGSISAWFEER